MDLILLSVHSIFDLWAVQKGLSSNDDPSKNEDCFIPVDWTLWWPISSWRRSVPDWRNVVGHWSYALTNDAVRTSSMKNRPRLNWSSIESIILRTKRNLSKLLNVIDNLVCITVTGWPSGTSANRFNDYEVNKMIWSYHWVSFSTGNSNLQWDKNKSIIRGRSSPNNSSISSLVKWPLIVSA